MENRIFEWTRSSQKTQNTTYIYVCVHKTCKNLTLAGSSADASQPTVKALLRLIMSKIGIANRSRILRKAFAV